MDCYASVEDSVVVLGPPRSGRTSSWSRRRLPRRCHFESHPNSPAWYRTRQQWYAAWRPGPNRYARSAAESGRSGTDVYTTVPIPVWDENYQPISCLYARRITSSCMTFGTPTRPGGRPAGHHRGPASTATRRQFGLARAGVDDETSRVKTNQDPFEAELGDLQGPTHWPSFLPSQARPAWADCAAQYDPFG